MPSRRGITSTRRSLLASALVGGVAFAQDAADGGVTAPAEAEKVTLQPVEVRGQKSTYKPAPTSVLRLPSEPVNTPQTVTAVPRTLIDEQQAVTLRDAMRNVSGLTISAGEGGRQGDSFNLRGFAATTDVFRDGVRDLGWYTRDTFNLQGVEVFFGPASVLFGRGSTGGAINLTTRKPTARASREVSLLVGSAPSGRLSLDVNQPLGERVQARVSGMASYGRVAGRDGVEGFRGGVAPSVRVKLTERTTLEADYLYQHESGVPDYGHPFANGLPVSWGSGVARDVFYGIPSEDREKVNAHVGTVRLLQRFNDFISLSNTLRIGGVHRAARPTAPRGLIWTDDAATIGRQRFETTTQHLGLVDQLDLRAHFFTGLFEHTLNAGFEFARETRDQRRNNFVAAGAPGNNLQADLFVPDPWPSLGTVSSVFQTANRTEQTTMGVYLSEQLGITRWADVLLSGRLDHLDTSYLSRSNTGALTQLGREDFLFNWRVGLLVHPLERTSVYAMYGTSTNPSAEAGTLTADTQSLAAEQNWTAEAGAKAELLDERLQVSGSWFRVEKTNARVANTDPTGPATILAGRQLVEGFNLGVAGRVVGPWMVFANYTYMPSRILSNPNAFLVGQALASTPTHAASLWTTVQPIERLTLGGGVVFQSAAAANNPANEMAVLNRIPEQWRIDVFASYDLGHSQLQLNLNNLANRTNYESYTGAQAVPSEGRAAFLTWRVRL